MRKMQFSISYRFDIQIYFRYHSILVNVFCTIVPIKVLNEYDFTDFAFIVSILSISSIVLKMDECLFIHDKLELVKA